MPDHLFCGHFVSGSGRMGTDYLLPVHTLSLSCVPTSPPCPSPSLLLCIECTLPPLSSAPIPPSPSSFPTPPHPTSPPLPSHLPPLQKLWQMINVNVAGITVMTRQCLKSMITRRRGAVINVCPSGALTGPRPLLTGYSATMVSCIPDGRISTCACVWQESECMFTCVHVVYAYCTYILHACMPVYTSSVSACVFMSACGPALDANVQVQCVLLSLLTNLCILYNCK